MTDRNQATIDKIKGDATLRGHALMRLAVDYEQLKADNARLGLVVDDWIADWCCEQCMNARLVEIGADNE